MIERQVEVLAGNHIAGRSTGAVIVVAHRESGPITTGSAAYQALYTLTGFARKAHEQQPGNPGRLLGQLAAEWVEAAGKGTGFGIFSRADGQLAIFVRGPLTVALAGAGGKPGITETLRGDTDLVVRAPVEAAGIFVDDAKGNVPGIPRRRGIGALTDGILPAVGVVVWFSGPEPSAATELIPAVEQEKAGLQGDTGPPEPGFRLAQTTRAAVAPEPDTEGVRVRGFRCARRHLSDPRAPFCTVCGMPVSQTQELSEGVRPALGKLILDDGSVYPLDSDCVFGRAPSGSEAAGRGLRPIKLEDTFGGMSRAHFEVRLTNWDVTVRDLGSTNGTRLRSPDTAEWIALTPGAVVPLYPGGEIMLANRILRYETASLRL